MGNNQGPRTKNEIGFAVCKTDDGRFVRGPVAEGTPLNVTIPLRCPPNSRIVGMVHTHPGGIPQPSEMDLAAAAKYNIANLCIAQPEDGVMNCFHRNND